jgi:hypothetical protein
MAGTRSTSTSRKPRTAARAASRPPTRSSAETERDLDEEPLSAAEAQEIEAEGQYVTAELCGEELQIIPPGLWRQSWQRLLNAGQTDAFAEKVIHPDDLELFIEIDPTNTELGEFVGEAARAAGESLGNSRGPAPSSRRTRRR